MKALSVTEKLQQKDVKPTANRILVYETMAKLGCPLSISDIEDNLLSIDKSSIFRVITLFVQHDVVHAIEDGSGSLKYEICHEDLLHALGGHVHFYCEKCHHTFCLEGVDIPLVQIPEGFESKSVNYMIKGICPSCCKKNEIGNNLA
ncbi:MAG: transcriptional repressor [Paludibacteraceae bacterium]|nr:transcriptional repressor [Paludibacteraceae bacterium]